MTSKIKDLN